MKKTKRPHFELALTTCKICLSPLREEIDSLIRRRVSRADLSEYYWKKLGYESANALLVSFPPHKNHPKRLADILNKKEAKKEPPKEVIPPTPQTTSSSPKSLEAYAQLLLERATDPEMMKKLSPNVILQAQKIILEKEKAKTERDNIRHYWLKMMSGLLQEEDAYLARYEYERNKGELSVGSD